jgi:diacylglycerol kinase family enzyme
MPRANRSATVAGATGALSAKLKEPSLHFVGVFNRDGGTFRTMDMDAFCATATKILGEYGHSIDCRVVGGVDLLPALRRAAKDGDVLLAGGGDGTVSAAAEVAFNTGVALAVLPAGTMNLFARSLHLPLVLEQALHAIGTSDIRAVDIATANGKPFVNQYSVGIHTRLVRIRETLAYHSRYGKLLASARALFGVVVQPPRFQAEVRTRRGLERRQCSAINVSNNLLGEGHAPHADELQSGTLGVYVARPMTTPETIRLCIDVLRGSWKENPQVFEHEVEQVTLVFPRKKSSAMATLDGELIQLESRIDLMSHPRALRVVAPAAAAVAAAA